MDPNVALQRLRDAFQEDPDHVDAHKVLDSYEEAHTVFRGLDEWLSKGGFLPRDWER